MTAQQMLDMLKKHRSSSTSGDEDVALEKFKNLSNNLNKPHMMTASVSIVPVSRELKSEDVSKSTTEEGNDGVTKGKGTNVVRMVETSSIIEI